MPLLAILFVVVPLVEVWLIVRVADLAGWGDTIALLFLVSVAGAVLVKREGSKAWRNFARALAEARMPAAEVVDGALVLVGGALMLTPGFATDVVGLLCVVPPSRALLNRLLRSRARGMFGLSFLPPLSQRPRERAPAPPDDAIDIEVVDVRRDEPDAPGATPRRGPQLGQGEAD